MKIKKAVKIISTILIIGAVIAGVLFGLRFFLNKEDVDDVTYQVKKEIYENVIEVSGTVAAAQKQTLQALSAGTVLGVYGKAGDKGKKGKRILE